MEDLDSALGAIPYGVRERVSGNWAARLFRDLLFEVFRTSGRQERTAPCDLEPTSACSGLNAIYLQMFETAAACFQDWLHFTKSGGIFCQRDRRVEMVNAVMFHPKD